MIEGYKYRIQEIDRVNGLCNNKGQTIIDVNNRKILNYDDNELDMSYSIVNNDSKLNSNKSSNLFYRPQMQPPSTLYNTIKNSNKIKNSFISNNLNRNMTGSKNSKVSVNSNNESRLVVDHRKKKSIKSKQESGTSSLASITEISMVNYQYY